jgi:hypothetical protein
VHIVAGPTGKRIEIDAFVFEFRVTGFLFSMAFEADFVLVLFFLYGIKLCVNQVTTSAIEVAPVMYAAPPDDRIGFTVRIFMASQASFQLLLAAGDTAASAKRDHPGKASSAMRTGHVETARSMA